MDKQAKGKLPETRKLKCKNVNFKKRNTIKSLGYIQMMKIITHLNELNKQNKQVKKSLKSNS